MCVLRDNDSIPVYFRTIDYALREPVYLVFHLKRSMTGCIELCARCTIRDWSRDLITCRSDSPKPVSNLIGCDVGHICRAKSRRVMYSAAESASYSYREPADVRLAIHNPPLNMRQTIHNSMPMYIIPQAFVMVIAPFHTSAT